jgi:hypothetical protein
MNLFSTRLDALQHLALHEHVPGSRRARYAVDDEGRRWVYKRAEDTGAAGLLGEALAQLLGRWLAAPVPEGAVYLGPDGPGWASRWVAAPRWSPLLRDRICNPAQVGAMLALDALLMNEHRSARDLLVVPSPDEARLTVLALDWGRLRLEALQDAQALPSAQGHARGLPLEALREGASAAAGVAERMDEVLLQEFVAESCAVARYSEATSLGLALRARCQNASALVARHLDALAGLP